MKPSISIVIPALNEEGNLESTVSDILKSLDNRFESYELLIFNDGSSDQTGPIADRLAANDPHIKAIHNPQNRGLGYNIRKGFEIASKEYVMWYPGDNGMQQKSLAEMFRHAGEADIIIPIIANPEFRSYSRRVISKAYVVLMNFLFGLKLQYYNGVCIYKSESVKRFKTSTQGFSFLAELLVLLIKSGHSYVEIPTFHRLRAHGKSNAFNWRNLLDVQKTLLRLIGIIYFKTGKKTMLSSDVPIA